MLGYKYVVMTETLMNVFLLAMIYYWIPKDRNYIFE